jgi:hypothetical protein
MPERRVENVPLARVYDALDAEAYRTFRVAMRRSRGGVVRVDDLVAALAEIAPQSMETVFGLASDAIAALMRPPTTEPDLVPMANEPALRTLLTDAYRRAIGQPVTPGHLLAALAQMRPLPAALARRPSASVAIAAPSRPRGLADLTDDEATAALGCWLAAQSLPRREGEDAVGKIFLVPGAQGRSLE